MKPDQVVSGSGTWSLTRSDGGREVRVRLAFTSVQGSNGRDLPYGAELFIQGSSKDLRLFYFIGDPDLLERVVFRRRASARILRTNAALGKPVGGATPRMKEALRVIHVARHNSIR